MKLFNLFAILGFIIFIGGGVQLLIMFRGAEGFSNLEGDLPSQIIYIFVYSISISILMLSKRRISLGITRNLWYWLLLAWTCFSVIWSGAPDVTIRHVIALGGTTLFSILLVNKFTIQEYIKLLAISLLITIVSSYLIIFFFPEIGISHVVTTEWRGIFTHKNHLGKAASLAVFIFSYLVLTNKKGKWFWFFGLLSSVGLLIGCQSATAIIITICIELIIILLFMIDRLPNLVWLGALASIIFVVFIPLPSVDQILEYFGKNQTLTGRIQLWDFSLNMALKEPLLGYGYGAFWLGLNGPSAQIGPDSPMSMDVTHSHNGFIELVLDLGFIGFFITFMTYLVAVGKELISLIKKGFLFQYSIYLIILIWIFPFNFTEQALLLRNSIFWVLFSSIILYQAKYELQKL